MKCNTAKGIFTKPSLLFDNIAYYMSIMPDIIKDDIYESGKDKYLFSG